MKTAWDRGWKQVKLYFMIGLPGETDADVIGIAETVQVRRRFERVAWRRLRSLFWFSCFRHCCKLDSGVVNGRGQLFDELVALDSGVVVGRGQLFDS